jgi:hypothetical protein
MTRAERRAYLVGLLHGGTLATVAAGRLVLAVYRWSREKPT